jgi:hypothetical protein
MSQYADACSSLRFRVSGTVIPRSWPDDRYDVIWTFTLTADATYAFGQVPQLLLSGDAATVIA